MWTLELKEKREMDKILEITKKTENKESGTEDLFLSLEINGYCKSYKKERIFYVGYVLAKNDIDFSVLEEKV